MPSSRVHGPKLTERDQELLVSLFKHRYLSTSQIERLHFPSHQTATRRLRLLAQAGYVSVFTALGIEEHLATLTEQGARLVAGRLSVPPTELGWTPWREEPKDYLFLKHFLLVTDFRIALTRACCERGDLSLLGFIPEYIGDRMPEGGVPKYIRDIVSDIKHPDEKIVHAPDGVFALQKDGTSALFFLEIDRGIEALTDDKRGFMEIVRFYLNYLASGGYQRYRRDFEIGEPFEAFRVLFLTSSQRRLASIRNLCGRVLFEHPHARRLFWLASHEVVAGGKLLSSEWLSFDPHDLRFYTIIP